MTDNSIEISVKGKWVRVPALDVGGRTIVVRGKWVKVAAIHDEFWSETEVGDPGLCVRKLKEQRSEGLRADIFTFAQKLPATPPKYEYPAEWDSVAAIRLSTFQDWWQRLPQETRKNVRRSQKRGVVVKVQGFDEDLIKGIADVNNDSPMRQGRPNAHYGKSLAEVRRDEESFLDRSDFICAYLGNEMIGFLKLVYSGEVAAVLNLVSKASQFDGRPANALIAKAVEVCEAKGMSHLTYGMFNYGNKRESPLRQFKIRNGFEEILIPRFYVPLTAKGSLCIKLRLHRGLVGILPPRIIAAALSARAKCRDLKLRMSRCSSMSERPNSDRQMECSNPPAGSNA
jgi:hypothetical protein